MKLESLLPSDIDVSDIKALVWVFVALWLFLVSFVGVTELIVGVPTDNCCYCHQQEGGK